VHLLVLLLALAAPSASPAPTPTPRPIGWHWTGSGDATFVTSSSHGPGTQPPEGPGFAIGSPLSPMTPYDVWSGAPVVPGNAGASQLTAVATHYGRTVDFSATFGIGAVTGSMTNAIYWTGNVPGPIDPHRGATVLPFGIAFPTHAGRDDASVGYIGLNGLSAGAADGSWLARAGYFDLKQTNRFVFIQPSFTAVTPSLGLATAESLGDGVPALDSWAAAPPGLPLYGFDAQYAHGLAAIELSDARLPALPGTAATLTMGTATIDHGDGTRYSFQALHLVTGGAPIATTTMYGLDAATQPGPQGELPTSTLGGQRQTILGASAAFHLDKRDDALIEIGRAWYDADDVIRPGSQASGGYYHLRVARKVGNGTLAAEGFRFEPRYATVILPYGVPENIWSVAWSWPGQWLKSNYQLVDNSALGANRQGYRVRYDGTAGALSYRASYAAYRQIDAATLANVTQTGFVDGFFLPQRDNAGTIADSEQLALWLAWHTRIADVSLDYVNDYQHRPYAPGHIEDGVAYVSPQTVLNLSRHLSSATLVDVGYGRYAMRGIWAGTPVDYGQNVAFAGAEFAQGARLVLLVQYRHSTFDGLPAAFGGASPWYGSDQLILREQFKL
jgi:hypothetical protein